jgi:hypothetical protein
MRTFDEVIMKCRFNEKGCEEKMNYSNILEHEKKCEKNPYKNIINNPVNLTNSTNDFSLKYNIEYSLVYINIILTLLITEIIMVSNVIIVEKNMKVISLHITVINATMIVV